MTTRLLIYRALFVIAAMILATIAIGWWGVLFVAVAFALVDRRWSVPAESGVAAAVAWLLLFLVSSVLHGSALIGLMSAAMSLPAFALPLLTVVFPALLAWSGATAAAALAHLLGWSRQGDAVVTIAE